MVPAGTIGPHDGDGGRKRAAEDEHIVQSQAEDWRAWESEFPAFPNFVLRTSLWILWSTVLTPASGLCCNGQLGGSPSLYDISPILSGAFLTPDAARIFVVSAF